MQIKKLFYSKDIDDQRILQAHWNRALVNQSFNNFSQ